MLLLLLLLLSKLCVCAAMCLLLNSEWKRMKCDQLLATTHQTRNDLYSSDSKTHGDVESIPKTCINPIMQEVPGGDYMFLPVNYWLLRWVVNAVDDNVADMIMQYIE